jgi:hypothetical protein
MNKSLFIPVSKDDFETVERIKITDPKNIQEVLQQIFEWIEDINWPIARELVKVLAGFDEMIIPFVIDLIRNPDGLREYSIYYYMLPLLTNRQLSLLGEELERVANNPSSFEKEEGYNKIALQYLQNIF